LASEPLWLTAEHLEELNHRIVSDSGEPFGILKPHELASAPTRPRQLYHYDEVEDLAVLAVRLMMAIVWAHPFEQGNKRTGFAAAEIFLDANGWLLDIPDFEDIAEMIIEATEDKSLEDDLVELFRRNLIELA
jgi:death-on-curing protein